MKQADFIRERRQLKDGCDQRAARRFKINLNYHDDMPSTGHSTAASRQNPALPRTQPEVVMTTLASEYARVVLLHRDGSGWDATRFICRRQTPGLAGYPLAFHRFTACSTRLRPFTRTPRT